MPTQQDAGRHFVIRPINEAPTDQFLRWPMPYGIAYTGFEV